jgi:hydroxymethylbilane synthase
MAESGQKLRLGTRGSKLALMQSQWVADQLIRCWPTLSVEIHLIKTTGDRVLDRPLHELGGKGLFTKEIELALLGGQVDFAVHSFKDVPITQPLVEQADLIIAAVPRREDARDALLSLQARSVLELRRGARVGTTSLRRRAQLLELRPDLEIHPVRGNIDTRLSKLRAGEFDAIILAMAGLLRAGLFDEAIATPLDPAEMLPAAGQGALALQCRRFDMTTRQILAALDDPSTAACVAVERKVVEILQGDCHSPIAALATRSGAGLASDGIELRIAVGRQGGDPPVYRTAASQTTASGLDAAIAACGQLPLR